jgi:hypothetical protein
MSDKKIKVNGVFTKISGDDKKLSEWEVFKSNTARAAAKIGNNTKKARIQAKLKRYSEIIQSEQFISMIAELTQLEHEIIQNQCSVNPKITMGTLKQTRNGNVVEHLIARAPFPFKDKNRNEFRMYLGKMGELPYATVEDVCKDSRFMVEVEKKVVSAMNDIIAGKTNSKVYMGNNPET